jgi:hypothetical protein
MGKRIENWKCGAGMNVLRLNSISRDGRLLYAILYGYKSKTRQHPFPAEQTLAKDLGCGKSKRLNEDNILHICQRRLWLLLTRALLENCYKIRSIRLSALNLKTSWRTASKMVWSDGQSGLF